ncbi:MAG: glycosyltransferase family 4 protein [Desulforhopalus sp.]
MKLLHVISQHPESTGSGIYLQNIITLASAAGHQNSLVAGISADLHPRLDFIDPQACRFVRFGSGTLNFPIPGMSDVMPYESSRFSELTPAQLASYRDAFTRVIHQAIADFSPDLIHSHHLWLVSAAARRTGRRIPMVTSCHSTDLRQFQQCTHLQQWVQPDCLDIERVLALYGGQAREISRLLGIPPQNIDIVGGGYNESLFNQQKEKPTPSPVQLLYAGKLSLAKGVDWLLRTLPVIPGADFHLHLAGSGSGEEETTCLNLAEKLGTKVTVHGTVSQQELARLMKRCHIFILPSFYEGLPLVLLEALASGCRIVTTDIPGCRELLGSAPQNLVRFVSLPELETIDRPFAKDWRSLTDSLRETLSVMMNHVISSPTPPAAAIDALVSEHSWAAVFEKISRTYRKACGSPST